MRTLEDLLTASRLVTLGATVHTAEQDLQRSHDAITAVGVDTEALTEFVMNTGALMVREMLPLVLNDPDPTKTLMAVVGTGIRYGFEVAVATLHPEAFQ